MSGVSRQRKFLYGGAVAVLLLANVMRWAGGSGEETSQETDAGVVFVTPIADVAVARDLNATPPDGVRDLFRRPGDGGLRPAVAAAPRPAPAQAPDADPLRTARLAAMREFEAMKLLGVMRAGDDTRIMLQYEGQTISLIQGQEVLPGFTIGQITTDSVRIDNTRLGLTGILAMGGVSETQIIGIDG
ncbi:hypothetical protein [Yoonia sediminilitoris]|uniref:Uncharacterized protein n=1 Tax=Yoonia sediminilitoris TaxID=1286148 RepID=A0A2T6KLH8_9RHOB|nr:hypothetical protein [Yoonia sediminilitoris]PUB17051.1 hypothetical protein C8N45_10261 [Yoonia sediminilitoris]RCW97346.1 hypothetical protein DFP92_10261 [Yoonia sediminilitoris]